MTTTKNLDATSDRPPIEPPPRERITYLDGWRGLAIIMVLLGHFFSIRLFSLAPFGVEFFFVLSGRLMAEILFVENFSSAKILRPAYFEDFSGADHFCNRLFCPRL